MSVSVTPNHAANIDYRSFLQYLHARGWAQVHSRRVEVAVRRKDETEVVVPVDRELGDFDDAMATAAERVARAEGRAVEAVLADLAGTTSDILRIARASDAQGALPVGDGAALLWGARHALLASACSVVKPEARFHRRMSLKPAETLLEMCRLGQPERGSFVLKLLCPTHIPDEPEPNFGRATVSGLMSALTYATRLARQGSVESILQNEAGGAAISANLCEAIGIMAKDRDVDLRLTVSWSPILPATNVPSTVALDRDVLPVFDDLARSLRPPPKPEKRLFVGRVVELAGEDNEKGELEGEVTLQLLDDEGSIKARTALDPARYRVALEAHRDQHYVRMHGVLHRRSKLSLLDGLSEFGKVVA